MTNMLDRITRDGRADGSKSRFVRWILALAAGLALLVGCTRPDTGDVTEITFAYWGTPEQQRAARGLIREFEEMNPHIRVRSLVMGYNRYFQKMQAMMVGNIAPDLMMVGVNYYDEWAHRGVLLDVTEDFVALNEMGEMMPVPREAVERDGRVFGLPVNITGVVTCVNLDAFRRAGIPVPADGRISWKELVEIAPRLSRRHGDPSAPTDYAMVMPSPIVFFWQEGHDLFEDPWNPVKVTINTPEAAEVLDFVRWFQRSGLVVPPEVGLDEGYRELFRDGRVAIFFDNLIGSLMFYDQTAFEWDILQYPYGSRSNVSPLGSMTIGVWSNSKKQYAARAFARHFASPQGAAFTMRTQRWQPSYREVAYGEEFLGMSPPASMHRFSEMMEQGASRQSIYSPGIQEVTRLFNNRMSQAYSHPEISSAEILRGLEEDLTRWVRRMQNRGVLEQNDKEATRTDNGDGAVRLADQR
jgi:multiple sugar transport system substrate-binding protein